MDRVDVLLSSNRKNVLHANFFHIKGFNIRPPTLPEALFPQMAGSIVIVIIMFIWLAFVMALVFSLVVIIVVIVTGMTFPAHLASRILTHDT